MMTPVTETPHVASRWWKVLVIAAVGMACFAAVLASFAFKDARQGRARIREGEVESCLRVARPTEEILARVLRDEMLQTAAVDPKFFPNIPPRVFDRLVRQQQALRAQRLREIEQFPPCVHRFASH